MKNEAETRADLIDPALRAAGWGVVEGSRISREYHITKGRLIGAGRRSEPDTADYVLIYRNHKLAVIEAKREELSESEGVAQAKHYAAKMAVRFAYATNGHKIYRIDMGALVTEHDTEGGGGFNPLATPTKSTRALAPDEGPVDRFPTPEELWALTFAESDAWRDRFAQVPFEDHSGSWDVRYYQDTAIQRALEAVGGGRSRILLTLATGTGKTAIAFQIAWKLFQARWNLSGQPTRRPRILFLADRNILADQAYNAFSSFADDARIRIAPDSVRKAGKVPTNASIFFTIFQTFMTGRDAEDNPAPYFGQYPPDFFDLIIIDECHRGGANDESNWRDILDYFKPAVQLGLTATPKRRDNVDTYAYFGEPVYIYSLKEGINDGFLTPFKVVQYATTLDEYVYTPDDYVVEGEVEEGRRYVEEDFNRIIEIKEREEKRVEILMNRIDQREKAELADLSVPTIQRMEASEGVIRGNVDSLMKLIAGFERAGVELAKDWRTDRYLRRLEAMMAVADRDRSFTLTGNGDVLEPDDGIIAIGSGGNFALAAARALIEVPDLTAEEVARRAMKIAGDICVYTNHSVVVETIA